MERFGRYVLLERIACGGMAEVFRAASVGTAGFSKLLAIKRILPHLAAEKAFVTMLIDEAKIAATLNHPCILQVLDLGREKEVYFIAMEFVAGQALNNVIATAIRAGVRLPPGFCMHVVAQALQGLAYAHEKVDATGRPMGIIHRDISPQNIMVAYDGSVKLADFGIAKAAERTTQTITGSLKGKPAYMSPEQVQGKPIDQRMDLYAMGVVLHELLAMKRMRKAQTDVQILLDVAKGEFPRFEDLGVDVPHDAADVVYRALEAEPERRWQTAKEFAHGIEDTARRLGWHFGAPQVSAVMQQLFLSELDKERHAQTHYQGVVNEFASANTEEISNIIHRVKASDLSGPVTVITPPPPNRDGIPTVFTPPVGGGSGAGIRGNTGTHSALADSAPAAGGTGVLKLLLAGVLMLGLGGAAAAAYVVGTREEAPRGVAMGQIIVATAPAGATVTVGGKKLPGVTPLIADNLLPGAIELVVAMDGMESAKEIVAVESGSVRKVHLVLKARELTIPVTSTPEGATVSVEDKTVGKTPTSVTITGTEKVTVMVELDGYVTVKQEVSGARAPEALAFDLHKEERAAPSNNTTRPRDRGRDRTRGRDEEEESDSAPSGGTGLLTLRSEPWAKIYIDGKDTERFTPVAEMSVPSGKHTIKLVNDEEGLSATFSVVIKAGQTLKLSKELN